MEKNSYIQELCEDSRTILLAELLASGGPLYLVGGTVRDAMLKRPPKDLDFASGLTPTELVELLEAAGIRVIPTGLQHQTVTVLPVDGLPSVEITTFRSKGMRPESGLVAGSSIEEDLSYRDFSINALAVDVATRELFDCGSGIEDLKRKKLSAVGNAQERFSEDPLRILRLIRLAAQLEFSIEKETWTAARAALAELPTVSIERIRDEFNKTLLSAKAGWGIMQLQRLGVLKAILPEIDSFVDFEQNRYHKADLFIHTLEVLDGVSPDLILRLSALFHDVGKPPTLSVDEEGERHFYRHESVGARLTREILTRLRYSNEIIKQVATLVKTHMRPLTAGPGGLRRLLRDTEELYPQWRELKESDSLACKLEPEQLMAELKDFDIRMQLIQEGPEVSPLSSLAIKGNDLLELGMSPGPKIGEILRALHEKVLDDPSLNTKEILLKLVADI